MENLSSLWEWFLAQSLMIRLGILVILYIGVMIVGYIIMWLQDVFSERTVRFRRANYPVSSFSSQANGWRHTDSTGTTYLPSDHSDSNNDSTKDENDLCPVCGNHGSFQGANPCPKCGRI